LRLHVCTFAVVLAVGLLAACGSSDDARRPTGQAAAKESGGALATARQTVANLSQPPKEIASTTPLEDPSRLRGKTFVFMRCAAPICVQGTPDVQASADALGVRLVVKDTGATPDAIARAWNDLLGMRPAPAAVIAPANPQQLFSKQLEKAIAQGMKVVLFNTPDPQPPGVSGVVYPPSDSAALGQAMADFVVADAGGDPGQILYITAPQFAALLRGPERFQSRIAELCASCKVSLLKVQASEIGRVIPQKVVSYLQRNPDVRYVVSQFGDLETGVPQAIKAAGITPPKLMASQAQPPNIELVLKGEQYADAANFLDYLSWLGTDAAARAVLGQPLEIKPAPIQFLTKRSIHYDPAKERPPFGIDYRAAFKKLWGG
jgi:ribose transport system substrate-binding protein